tara:strand:+ start:2792 stop:3121 length:330 start_codon:yes stop_codon:yes gene_type:complete
MNEYQKLEWLHSQISELKDGVEVDLETMQSFIEDLREPYLKKYKCSECGGTNLLWKAWVDEFDNVQYLSFTWSKDDSGSDTWCDDCGCFTKEKSRYTSDTSVVEVSENE